MLPRKQLNSRFVALTSESGDLAEVCLLEVELDDESRQAESPDLAHS